MTDRRNTRRLVRSLSTTLGSLALCLLGAASASAATEWQLEVRHGPEHLAPGQPAQYIIFPYNVGDTASSGACPGVECVTVTATLPPGVVATGIGFVTSVDLFLNAWACSGTTVVTCTLEGANSLAPAGPAYHQGGQAPPIFVTVDVPPGASGTLENEVTISGGGGAPVSVKDQAPVSAGSAGFGIRSGSLVADAFDGSGPAAGAVRQAGAHPAELRTDFDLNMRYEGDPLRGGPFIEPDREIRDVTARLPQGLVGNPQAVPACSNALFEQGVANFGTACPADSQVGIATSIINQGNNVTSLYRRIPIYNMAPPPGAIAAFGLSFAGVPVRITASLDPSDYSVVATVHDLATLSPVSAARTHLWGVPADPSHDALRFNPLADPLASAFGLASTAPVKPFLTMPSQCDSADALDISLESWAAPAATSSGQGPDMQMTGCESQKFSATTEASPSSDQADSPSGLSFDLRIPQSETPSGFGTPPMRKAVVTLPQGVAVNPSSADGLDACTPSQIGLHTNVPVACPAASKIGVLELETPVLEKTVKGSVYLAKQLDNPFHSLLALYFVLEDKERGLLVKLPGKVAVDPVTGQITTTFDDNPQLPFSNLHVELKQGPRAPLRMPERCGTYTTEATLTPWNSSLPAVQSSSSFQVTSGPNGGPCPNGGFDPKLIGGLENPVAGSTSPFTLRLTREDGEQQLSSLDISSPEGLTAYLKGVPYGSQVGTVAAGAGAGSNPFYVRNGKVLLEGPYRGAPLSLLFSVPAVAGPFDLGTVNVRAAIRVDPETGRITAKADPLPTILQGIPLDLRDVRVSIDRPHFILAPTSCEEQSIGSTVISTGGAVAHPSQRFQVGECASLPFRPKLSLRLKGKTNRGAHPALRAVLRMPQGGANIARLQVALPGTELLENAHIRTICTRVQFAAGNGGGEQCPAGSVYGHVRATSPLVDYPLEGPVILRSSSHKLPDLVGVVRGPASQPLVIASAGRIDSPHGRIRTTFESFPDVPVSKIVLTMQGRKKGLLVNSTDICRAKPHATALFDGQNGKTRDLQPLVRARCGGKAGRKAGKRRP